MRDALRVALFGAGGFGVNHVECLEKLQAEGAVDFVAVADPAVADLAGEKQRLKRKGVGWFADFRELMAAHRNGLDAVVISTPIPWHLPMLEMAMDAGLWIFLEKPPVPLLQDYLRVCARPESAKVAVGFKLVADPHLWALKNAMGKGAFGRILSIRTSACWPRLDSYYARASWAGKMVWRGMPVFDGPATNALAHIVHHIMFLGGETASGFGVPETVRGEVYRARDIESYDLCCLAGGFANGTTFSGAFCHAVEQRTEWQITVRGERGMATLTKEGVTSDVPLDAPEPLAGSVFEECWRDFYRFVTGQSSAPLTNLAACRGYVAATNAMLVSSGAIHDVPREVVRRFEKPGDGGWDVDGIAKLAELTRGSGRTLAELGVPWARAGKVVEVARLVEIPFERYVSASLSSISPAVNSP